MLTPVEHGPQPHHRRPLFGGHAVVLARSHRELAQAVALRQLAQAPEVRPRGLGVARCSGGIVIRPLTFAYEREEILQIALRMPGLRLLAGEVDLDERRDRRAARAADSLESEWQSSQSSFTTVRLAALQVADEVPAEGVAVASVLGLEVLRAVLADDLDPGLGQRAQVLERRRTSSPRRSSRRGRARLGCARSSRAPSQAIRPTTPCRPVPASSRRCEKKRSGWQPCRGRRARPARSPRRAAPARPRSRGRACRRARCSAPKARAERLGHVLADLVAARPDPGPDDRGERAAAERLHARRDDSGRAGRASPRAEPPAPACRRSSPTERDRQAVGGRARSIGRPGSSRPEPVTATASRRDDPAGSARRTSAQWCCQFIVSASALGADLSAQARRRFSSTARGSSSVARPRLSDSNGAAR